MTAGRVRCWALRGALVACAWLNATTAAHAAIRVYGAVLDPRQVVPPAASNASGAARFVIDTATGSVSYHVTFGPTGSPVTALHIHGAPGGDPGITSAVLQDIGDPGRTFTGVWHPSATEMALLLDGRCYLDVHTQAAPVGELRAQIVPFHVLLDSDQELPPSGSPATGWGTVVVDTAAHTIRYHIAYSGMGGDVIASHFHGPAPFLSAAFVKRVIPSGPSPLTGTVSYAAADQPDILAGLWYVNLHTAAVIDGEIRGQVVPAVLPMDGSAVVPGATATGSGFVFTSLDTANNVLALDVHVVESPGAETAAHVHGDGPPSTNAPVRFELPLGSRVLAPLTYPAGAESALLSGLWSLDVHSSLAPAGAMRTQLAPWLGAVVSAPPRPPLAAMLAVPAPFRDATTLSFAMPEAGEATLGIVGADGRRVRGWPAREFATGAQTWDWDGRDDAGRRVPPGCYFAQLVTPAGARGVRLVRLR